MDPGGRMVGQDHGLEIATGAEAKLRARDQEAGYSELIKPETTKVWPVGQKVSRAVYAGQNVSKTEHPEQKVSRAEPTTTRVRQMGPETPKADQQQTRARQTS